LLKLYGRLAFLSASWILRGINFASSYFCSGNAIMPNTVGEPSPEAVKEVVVATGCKPLRAKTYLNVRTHLTANYLPVLDLKILSLMASSEKR